MSVKMRLKNPDISLEERSYLTSDYLSGTTLITRNNGGFTTQWYAIVGEPGHEQTESSAISAITGNTNLTIAALKFSHTTTTPIYQSQWTQIDIVRATTLTGSYSAIADSPFNISWDDPDQKTTVLDASGATTNYYKYRFYNPTTGTYSAYSGAFSGGGLDKNTAGYAIKKIRKNTLAKTVDDETMFEYMTDFQDMVYDEMPKAWWFTREGTQTATVDGSYKFDIFANWPDLLSIKYVLYRYINGSTDITYPLTERTPIEMYNLKADSNQSKDDSVKAWAFLPPTATATKGYIALHPTNTTDDCFVYPVYNIELSDVTSFSDVLIVPKPQAYKSYVLYRIAKDIKNDDAVAQTYLQEVATSIQALKRRSKRQVGMEEFKQYRGPSGMSRLMGNYANLSNDDRRERFW